MALKTFTLAATIALAPLAASTAAPGALAGADAKPAPAAASAKPPGKSRPDAQALQVKRIHDGKGFKAAMGFLDAGFDRIVSDTIALTEIPSPPHGEAKRAAAFLALLKAEPGLVDVEQDAEGNVMALRKGTGGGPLIVIAAHMDTVFPIDTDVTVRREGNELHAPGVGDDTVSLAVLLGFIRAMDAAHIQTRADILFVGDVGEEGPGNLRGMRYLFTKGKYAGKISAFVSLEPGDEPEVTNGGVGYIRYHVTYKGPGGHSYGAFGLVNPAYALGNAMGRIGQITVPAEPKTTYNVGVMGGGVSVNSIPNTVFMDVDMRSEDAGALKTLDGQVVAAINQSAEDENKARSTARGKVSVTLDLIGERPVGLTDPTLPIVRTAAAAISINGWTPGFFKGSTDSNMPMSLGIPAVTFPSGFRSGRAHSPEEYIDVTKAPALAHMSSALLLILALAGAK
jgi:tripeptide aminopeptidase